MKESICITCKAETLINKRTSHKIAKCDECNKKELGVCPICGKQKTNKQTTYCSGTCGRKANPNHISKEGMKNLRRVANEKKLGGHTSKKAIYYEHNGKEYYLHSSYEVKVAESLDANGIKWERPEYLFWIDSENIKHRYYPDFYLNDYDVYLDPKNDYLIIKDNDKINRVCEQNNVKVLILNEKQLLWEIIKEYM